jgi:hypothetical protein
MTDAPEFAREETRAGQADAVHMHDELAQPAKRRSSGSANRQRQAAVCVRLLPEQLAQLADAADAARMSVPAYLLAGRLGEGHPAPRRRQRRASADAAALMRALVAFHRANNNLNQLARTGNTLALLTEQHGGDRLLDEVRELRRAVDLLRDEFAAPLAAILEAVHDDREG